MAALMAVPACLSKSTVTICGFGALVSEYSSRLTFPDLTNFRLVRIQNYQRVFAVPHLFLIRAGAIDPTASMRIAALAAEPCDRASLVACAFDVTLTDDQRQAFMHREGEYSIVEAPIVPLDGGDESVGILCAAGTDAALDPVRYSPAAHGLTTIWHWPHDSGLLPADVYLRHILLATGRHPDSRVAESMLDDTLLADRVTTLRAYLEQPGQRATVMAAVPPPGPLAERFCG